MNDIIDNVTTILNCVWSLMNNELLPGISIKSIFLFMILASILAWFFSYMVFGDN